MAYSQGLPEDEEFKKSISNFEKSESERMLGKFNQTLHDMDDLNHFFAPWEEILTKEFGPRYNEYNPNYGWSIVSIKKKG